jgi:hypothetical protein
MFTLREQYKILSILFWSNVYKNFAQILQSLQNVVVKLWNELI